MAAWLTSHKRLTSFKIAWLITLAIVAVYVIVIAPLDRLRTVSENKTGLAAISLWQQGLTFPIPAYNMSISNSRAANANQMAAALVQSEGYLAFTRKIVHTLSLTLTAKYPEQASAAISRIAARLGGWLENSEVGSPEAGSYATASIRVPAERADEARSEIIKLATRVESEKTDAKDVTKEYVDLDARLRNLHAEEEQYLGIMKQAATVKDALEVTEKLNGVRGQIEQQQAEFNALAKQTQTVEISVELRAEADAQVFGLHWRPLYELKLAARQGLDGLASYASSIATLIFLLPTILLWSLTILLAAALGWRALKWAGRVLFAFPKAVTT